MLSSSCISKHCPPRCLLSELTRKWTDLIYTHGKAKKKTNQKQNRKLFKTAIPVSSSLQQNLRCGHTGLGSWRLAHKNWSLGRGSEHHQSHFSNVGGPHSAAGLPAFHLYFRNYNQNKVRLNPSDLSGANSQTRLSLLTEWLLLVWVGWSFNGITM